MPQVSLQRRRLDLPDGTAICVKARGGLDREPRPCLDEVFAGREVASLLCMRRLAGGLHWPPKPCAPGVLPAASKINRVISSGCEMSERWLALASSPCQSDCLISIPMISTVLYC